jgi:hypothetical protein
LEAAKVSGSSASFNEVPLTRQNDYIPKVRQAIRMLLDDGSGGYQATARLASVNRRSRTIKNILRELLIARYPLILLGDPGTGKSMTLREAGRMLAEAELQRIYPILTIYLRLGDFEPRGEIDVNEVMTFVRAALPAELHPFLGDLIRDRRLVILFDGMDEMNRSRYGDSVKALSDFASLHTGYIRSVFSCRINDFSPAFRHRQLVLLPFDRRQVRTFIRTRIGLSARIEGEIWNSKQIAVRLLGGEISEQIANPMTLSLACYYINDEKNGLAPGPTFSNSISRRDTSGSRRNNSFTAIQSSARIKSSLAGELLPLQLPRLIPELGSPSVRKC